MSQDLVFNLKVDNSDLRNKLRESESDMKTMGEKMFGKKELGDPSEQAKKFMDQFGKGIDSMRKDKRFDIMSHLMDQMNDPATSMQSKSKMAKRMQTMLEDMDLIMKSKMREFNQKGKLAGFSPEAIQEGMRHGLGETGEMWMGAGGYSKSANQWGSGGEAGGGNARAEMNNYAKKAAYYLIGYMISDAIKSGGAMYQSMEMEKAGIQQRAGTTFDLNSIMGTSLQTSAMHRENIMEGLQVRKQGYEVGGQFAGIGVGTIVGALLAGATGGVSLGIAPMIGASLGSELGGIFGTKDITGEMKLQTDAIAKDKMVGQLMGIANQRVGVYDEMSTARSRFRARTGEGDVGGSGTGYTQAELYGLGTQQSGVSGNFDKQTFTDQLRFSRAYGFNPGEIFNAGVTTRYTGQNVGASELFARKDLAEKTGMGNRLPELIQALNSLSGVMTKVGVSVTESNMMQAANLPFAIFGDSARGRMGDLGMETLMGVNNIFNQGAGTAGDAFLYQALKPKSLQDFDVMKEKGVFDNDNMKAVLGFMEQFQSKGMSERVLKGLGMESASLRKGFVDAAFNEDGTVNKEFLEKMSNIDMSSEESKKDIAALLGVSEDAVSDAEKHKKDMVAAMVKTGESISKSVKEMQMKDVEMQNAILNDSVAWGIITNRFEKGIFDFQQAVNKLLGIDATESKNTNWNLITGDERKGVLSRLSKKDKDYEISALETPPSPDAYSLYFPLMELPEIRKETSVVDGEKVVVEKKYYKYLRLLEGGLKKLNYPYGDKDAMMEQQLNITEIAKNALNPNHKPNTLTTDEIRKNTGQGGKGGGFKADDPGWEILSGMDLENMVNLYKDPDYQEKIRQRYSGSERVISDDERKKIQELEAYNLGDKVTPYIQDFFNDFYRNWQLSQPSNRGYEEVVEKYSQQGKKPELQELWMGGADIEWGQTMTPEGLEEFYKGITESALGHIGSVAMEAPEDGMMIHGHPYLYGTSAKAGVDPSSADKVVAQKYEKLKNYIVTEMGSLSQYNGTDYKYMHEFISPEFLEDDIKKYKAETPFGSLPKYGEGEEISKPEGQSSKDINVTFVINAADRAKMHSDLDTELDKLAQMAHPSKLVNNF